MRGLTYERDTSELFLKLETHKDKPDDSVCVSKSEGLRR